MNIYSTINDCLPVVDLSVVMVGANIEEKEKVVQNSMICDNRKKLNILMFYLQSTPE